MKQRLHAGFFLLEFLIYFVLVVSVTVLTLQFMLYSYQKVLASSHRSHVMSMLSIAHDVLISDIYKTVSDETDWTVAETNHYRWSGESDIEWYIKKNKLLRSIGRFDQEENEWEEVIKTVIADNSAEIRIVPSGNLVTVTLQSVDPSYTITRTVLLKNRKLL